MPSIRQIASVCGFSKSTVAAALRNDSEIAGSTRKLIQATAAKMGYRTDARMNELMSHLRQGRPSKSVCNLAWLNTSLDKNAWSGRDYTKVYLDSARRRAEQLGYSLEEIWMGDPQLTLPQLTRRLKSRGIRGLVLPLPVTCPLLHAFDWQNYATVALGENNPELTFNRVVPHNLRNMMAACDAIHALGYRRPALIISEHADIESANAFSSAFIRCQQKLTGCLTITIPADMDDVKDDVAWVKNDRPDIIIGNTHQQYDKLVTAGVRIPEDLAFVHLHLGPDTPDWAGIAVGQANLAAATIEAVIALLHRNEIGPPTFPKEIALLGQWRDGWTAPRRKPSHV